MAVGKSVQFNSVENVVGAYHMRGVPAFSIFQGNQFMIYYQGDDMDEGEQLLREFCNMIQHSAAIYTLAVYEEFNGKINAKTPFHGSWNFRFQNNTDFQKVSGLDEIRSQMAAMNMKLESIVNDQIEKESDEEETENSTVAAMDKIAGFISHPLIQQLLPVVMGMIQKNNDMEAKGIENKIAGVPGVNMENEISENLYQAICEMMIVEPDIEKHLIKLGNLAKSNPKKFKSLMGYMAFV